MPRKFFPLFALLFIFTVAMARETVSAQTERNPAPKPLVLDCCRCLGDNNKLDLSTVAGNPWMIAGNQAFIQTSTHSAWTNNPGPAKWVSITAGGGNGGVPGGSFVYQLRFTVPNCTIDQKAAITGNLGGDDEIALRLDNPSGPVIAQCTGGWCFNTAHHPAIPFNMGVGPGNHTLYVTVVNGSLGPSGMFVNATLTAKCAAEPIKPSMEPGGPRR